MFLFCEDQYLNFLDSLLFTESMQISVSKRINITKVVAGQRFGEPPPYEFAKQTQVMTLLQNAARIQVGFRLLQRCLETYRLGFGGAANLDFAESYRTALPCGFYLLHTTPKFPTLVNVAVIVKY